MSGIILVLVVMFAPPIALVISGMKVRKNKKRAKKLYIAAAVYLIIGVGTCLTILNNLTFH